MQQQANRERVIIRTVAAAEPAADCRRCPFGATDRAQPAVELDRKFTGAGGQMIVSTALNDDNEAVLRVRDTGVGMSENELPDRA